MATSTLTLYTNSGMRQENNYIVEYIGQYLGLNAGGVRVIEDFQYIKNPASPQAFKVNTPQDGYNNSVVDYASLLQDGDMYYYFIVDAKWTSQDCLTLVAVPDTLNTFQNQYSLTDRSNIERQHVDRVRLIGPRPTGDSINEVVTNVISTTREELQPEMLMARKEVLSGDMPVDSRYTWYLIYQTNTSSGNPEILMCADRDIDVGTDSGTAEYIVTAADLRNGLPARMVFGKFKAIINTDGSETIDMDGSLSISIDPDSTGNLSITYMPFDGLGYIPERRTGRVRIQLDGTTSLKVYNTNGPNFNQPYVEENSPYTLIGRAVCTSIDTIDRTMSNLYRVIECPYCPLDLQITNGAITGIPTGWKYDQSQNKLSCDNLSYEFPERLAWTEENVMNLIAGQVIKAQRAKLSQYSRKDHQDGVEGNVVDPKTYISTLRSYNFVYDAVTWSLIPEDLAIPNNSARPDLIRMYYKQSNNISSDCGFRFDIPEFTMGHRQYFDQYMFSARSNELPLYSSDWINYQRNGYNYDKKANSLRTASDIVGILGGSIATGASSAGQILAFQNRQEVGQLKEYRNMVEYDLQGNATYPNKRRLRELQTPFVTGLIGAGVNVAAGVANAVLSHYQRENALEQKINEYRNRAFSVSSTGNHDLFKWYSGNKVILFEFEPREEVRELINDFFSLFGYAQGYYMVPDLDSRLWFNYCRGTVDIDNYKKKRSLEENKADIVQRFQQGVYKIHRVKTPLGIFWDMKLERQNYERAILPESWCR